MVRVGLILGAFGVEGAVKVSPLTDFPDRFAPGAELCLDGRRLRVEWGRSHPAWMVVKLQGLDDRTAAEAVQGRYLEVPEEEVRPLPEGVWYHHDLVGLSVSTAGGRELGTLAEVWPMPANDVWVAREDGQEHLIPAVREAVLEVDLEHRRVTVADWILDVEEA
ncbi:MAG TPA: ribosome maturation factor RimM [Candidatus Dormibacteraeota bacterium]|nr:ribosome maturation factor RimM [Candidatus Dormibacteraeota bacterium]